MASYELLFRKSVAKDLRTIPKQDVKRILECFNVLANDPRPPGSQKLSAQERYRLRQGVYRIVYEIHDLKLIILVIKIAHRREVYRGK
jgi:mRNA interferase RelE/StbE